MQTFPVYIWRPTSFHSAALNTLPYHILRGDVIYWTLIISTKSNQSNIHSFKSTATQCSSFIVAPYLLSFILKPSIKIRLRDTLLLKGMFKILCALVCPYLSDICFWHWATTDSTLSGRGGTCQTVAVASFVCFVLLLLSFKSWAKCWDKDSFVVGSWCALCASLFGKTETSSLQMIHGETKQ